MAKKQNQEFVTHITPRSEDFPSGIRMGSNRRSFAIMRRCGDV